MRERVITDPFSSRREEEYSTFHPTHQTITSLRDWEGKDTLTNALQVDNNRCRLFLAVIFFIVLRLIIFVLEIIFCVTITFLMIIFRSILFLVVFFFFLLLFVLSIFVFRIKRRPQIS